ncbi:YVTN family beta-propeller repeat protein [Saccharopolyspora sp. NPDC002376]
MRLRKSFLVVMGIFGLMAAACSAPEPDPQMLADVPVPAAFPAPPQTDFLPGMPPPLDPDDVYAATRPGHLSEAMNGVRNLVYVPNSLDDTVSVIDPNTFKVVDTFPGGNEPQHVVPSYDLKTLYVTADKVPAGTLTPVDPMTGRPGIPLPIQDPYNLYFTPDGSSAIVVAEYYKRLDFYDPHTWQPQGQLHVPDCAGVNHMDFTADGKFALVTCEFANKMIVLDVAGRQQVRTFQLDRVPNGMPQDSRLAPDGRTFYVADMMADGVYLFDGAASKQIGFVPTGKGAHGVYFSRDSRRTFVANRGEGSVSVLDTTTHQPIGKWQIPGGGSPDMGGVSADGKQLWLSGRYHNEVYVFDTDTGQLLARIRVGAGPHGLTYMPQPGRYSLGHTSNLR